MTSLVLAPFLAATAVAACPTGVPICCSVGAAEVDVMPCLSIHGGRAFTAAAALASAVASPFAPGEQKVWLILQYIVREFSCWGPRAAHMWM